MNKWTIPTPCGRAKFRAIELSLKSLLALLSISWLAIAQTPTPAPTSAPVEINDATLLPLPKLSSSQVHELIGDVITQFRLTSGYRQLDPKEISLAVPAGITVSSAMTRGAGAGAETVVLGFILPPRRLPQLWVAAWSGDINMRAPWPPLSQGAMGEFGRTVNTLLTERNRVLSRLSLSDLESRIVSLSYVDADAALFALRAMGYAAITDSDSLAVDDSYKGNEIYGADANSNATVAAPAGQNANASLQGLPPEELKRLLPKFPAIRNLPTNINFDRLPLIVRMPSTEPRNMGLVGANDGAGATGPARDQLGLSIVPQAGSQLNETVTGGVAQLLVLYHPSYPEQFKNLRRIVAETIDRPARQVFVEGLVLEISSEALRELGVKWDLQKGSQSFTAGGLTTAGIGDSTFSFARSALNVTPSQMLANIKALVQDSKAEVLSRPSVLTLDNRQATIRVGSDIPIATSKDASDGKSGRVAFAF